MTDADAHPPRPDDPEVPAVEDGRHGVTDASLSPDAGGDPELPETALVDPDLRESGAP